ncbi:dihydroxyacetone kinase [Verruconis gallopava]|uniref:Dihydroxyacetone kinase n=1 Tax=Verruconis gallopava TaxID=253628 RepID=A0A0D1Y244_9PEZI|nr:dihydroxyacetone kinase [Verruconis gallopava]KIW09111.1 dihydroxyacetone kinase [Verruconis gallopava]
MSRKHFFKETTGVVVQGLRSLVSRNNHLALDEANKVVYSTTHSPSKIAIVSGGGAGHEPAWSGYVGDGMLSAAVSGEVFASPSTKQIMAGVRHVPSDVGLILCITNYTGDNLHFGLAREKAAANGQNVAVISLAEDVALGRKKSEGLGRRGLAGNMYVLKLVGAAAEEGWSFERCVEIGTQINANLVTVGTSLDHCHIPGRAHHEQVADDACVLGMGIHNEPGLLTISPMPSPEEIVGKMLSFLLDPNDSERAFVEFREGDEVSLLINNFGGLSVFELEALADVTLQLLEKDWKIKPVRNFVSVFETSLNGPGFSISLANISGVARSINSTSEEVLRLLDAPTTAPAWPKNGYATKAPTNGIYTNGKMEELTKPSPSEADIGPQVNPESLEKVLRKACNAAIAAEPEITKYDIQMGDGDCGEAVAGACTAILAQLDAKAITSTSFLEQMDIIVDTVEDIGGSLFAIIAILLTAFTNSIRQQKSSGTLTIETVSKAVGPAIEGLMKYTSARVGGRTVMDTFIPFCETLQNTSDLEAAVQAAEEGARSTAGMKAKFGRATYVGDKAEELRENPPDPGAYALSVFLRALADGVANL